jgi:hypothetical protein
MLSSVSESGAARAQSARRDYTAMYVGCYWMRDPLPKIDNSFGIGILG